MDKLYVIKIGGNIIDDESKLSSFLKDFSSIRGKKILIHGGGKLATKLAEQMGVPQKMIDGRRVTDKETLDIVTMVYAGSINKNIVAQLQKNGCNAMGVTGADGNIITAHKRIRGKIDYGFAGDIDKVNTNLVAHLFLELDTIVLAPITHDKKGQLLNTNADTIAQEMATAMSRIYEVSLVYVFEKAGVLLDSEDDATLIPHLNHSSYQEMKLQKTIYAGMIPKLDNAFTALNKGVTKVIIGKADQLNDLVMGRTGTLITNGHVSV